MKTTQSIEVFLLQDVARVEDANFVLVQKRDYLFVLVERVHLPEGLNGPTLGHHQLVCATRVTLSKLGQVVHAVPVGHPDFFVVSGFFLDILAAVNGPSLLGTLRHLRRERSPAQ